MIDPKPNDIWMHSNGILYRVIMLTNMQSKKEKYPPTVVYETISNGNVWSRPLSDWHRSMTFVPWP